MMNITKQQTASAEACADMELLDCFNIHRKVKRCMLSLVLLFSVNLLAQKYTRNEVGAGASTQSDYQGLYGPFGLYTYNLSPNLAIEGFASYFPLFQKNPYRDSGRETLLLAGVKAGWRGRRFGVYGKIDPGIASFSCGLSYYGADGNPYTRCQRRTHFTLQYGGVAEYSLTNRTALRLDAAQTLITEFDQVLSRFPDGSASLTTIGHVAPHLDLRLGVTHSFGVLRDVTQETIPSHQTFDLGGLFALHPRVHILNFNLQPGEGWGGWGSWNFSKHYSLDSTIFYEPRNDHTLTYQDGGMELDVYAGLKAGIRRDRVGFFGKIRPGINLFNHVVDSQIPPYPQFTTYSKLPNPALDTGGVVEVYPSRHTILRFDAGADTIFYRSRTIMSDGHPLLVKGGTAASPLMTFGAGFRF